jgi:hypothetical protein
MIKNPSVAQAPFSKRFKSDDVAALNSDYNSSYGYAQIEFNNANYPHGYGYSGAPDLNSRIPENRVLLFTILNPKYNITVVSC